MSWMVKVSTIKWSIFHLTNTIGLSWEMMLNSYATFWIVKHSAYFSHDYAMLKAIHAIEAKAAISFFRIM